MSYQHHMLGLCLVGALPVAVGQVESAPAASAQEICRRLIEESREVDRLLRTVSDRDSGRAAAAELKPRMEYMLRAMEQLGKLPIASPEDARLLEGTMRDLMHITQGYVPVLQRLAEVNAYGADELINLFRYYRMDAGSELTPERRDETPLARSYSEWCDSLEDVLYLLRKINSVDSARDNLSALEAAVQKAEQRAAQVERLQSGLSPRQVVSERVPADRLRRVGDDLRGEIRRLRDAGSYGNHALNAALLNCSSQIRG
ncbi:MAG: hypothetical protein IJ956_07680 [Akkermansia sp.]|nr:hypothetical protein [Akkermansia sp.]